MLLSYQIRRWAVSFASSPPTYNKQEFWRNRMALVCNCVVQRGRINKQGVQVILSRLLSCCRAIIQCKRACFDHGGSVLHDIGQQLCRGWSHHHAIAEMPRINK